MICRIEALNFRCLRYVAQDLDRFHVLVGPNASGKTTFMDVVAFAGDLISAGFEGAIEKRTNNWQDLVWQRTGDRFELALEMVIPEVRRGQLPDASFSRVRYEIGVGLDEQGGELGLVAERVLLLKETDHKPPQQYELFPREPVPPETILSPKSRSAKTVVNKVSGGNDNFYDETGKGWDHAFKLGPRRSALANLPEDESKFPVTTWLKGILAGGVQRLVLNSLVIRKPSPPGQPKGFRPDGSNLPWVIESLKNESPQRYEDWMAHLRTALPDLKHVCTIERPEDRHRYLVIGYKDGLKVPSWMASDGTLRLLALTLPAYLVHVQGVFLIEEPENGIHPRAVEAAFQSLSSVYDAQILLATHSPVILSVAEPSHVLCFSKTESGSTDVVRGTDHPRLRDWQGETSLGVLFAGGVLG